MVAAAAGTVAEAVATDTERRVAIAPDDTEKPSGARLRNIAATFSDRLADLRAHYATVRWDTFLIRQGFGTFRQTIGTVLAT